MPLIRYLVALMGIAIGVVGMAAGEADDSPGLQLLGVLMIVGGIVVGVRAARRRR